MVLLKGNNLMINEKKLTVFIVTYNRAHLLKLSIESVLIQTYIDFNLIILDNASTDNTQQIVNSFADDRIHYIKHETNIGGYNNINYAVDICQTKYFIIFHDDDIMKKDLIEKELEELERNEDYSIVSSLSTLIDDEGNELITQVNNPTNKKNLYQGNEYLQNFLQGGLSVVCPSVMYRNSFIKSKKLHFNSKVGPASDQYLWFEVEKYGGIICQLNQALIKYRIHKTQDSHINNGIMEIDLLYAVSKNIISDNNKRSKLLMKKYSIRLSLTISRKFINKLITKNLYCEKMDTLIEINHKSRVSKFSLKSIKNISMKAPFIFTISFYILKLFRNIRRKNNGNKIRH